MKRICLNKSVLDFIESKIDKESSVLEFGSGWSSRWFADRCGRLVSVETDRRWAQEVRDDLHGADCDARVLLVNDPSSVSSGEFDLVLVDCMEKHRAMCVRSGWSALRTGGWLIFDDAQRPRHAAAIRWLHQHGDPVSLGWAPGDIDSAVDRLALAWKKK